MKRLMILVSLLIVSSVILAGCETNVQSGAVSDNGSLIMEQGADLRTGMFRVVVDERSEHYLKLWTGVMADSMFVVKVTYQTPHPELLEVGHVYFVDVSNGFLIDWEEVD